MLLACAELTITDAIVAAVGPLDVFVNLGIEGYEYSIARGRHVDRFHCLHKSSLIDQKQACMEAFETALRILAGQGNATVISERIVWSPQTICLSGLMVKGVQEWRLARSIGVGN